MAAHKASRIAHQMAFAWWERWSTSRQGSALLFIWAAAEATVWPIVPDFLLAPMTVGNRRRYTAPLCAATLGMALGGTATYLFAYSAPLRAARLLRKLPTVHEPAITRARAHLQAHGVWALLFQPWSGIPFKVWAVEGGARRLQPLHAIPIFIAARAARMAIIAALARVLSARFTGFVRKWFPYLFTAYAVIFFLGWWRVAHAVSCAPAMTRASREPNPQHLEQSRRWRRWAPGGARLRRPPPRRHLATRAVGSDLPRYALIGRSFSRCTL